MHSYLWQKIDFLRPEILISERLGDLRDQRLGDQPNSCKFGLQKKTNLFNVATFIACDQLQMEMQILKFT